jgi:hypothetical protein
MPWSTSSLLITGVPDVHTNLCSCLTNLPCAITHSPLLYVSISTYAVHQVEALLLVSVVFEDSSEMFEQDKIVSLSLKEEVEVADKDLAEGFRDFAIHKSSGINFGFEVEELRWFIC